MGLYQAVGQCKYGLLDRSVRLESKITNELCSAWWKALEIANSKLEPCKFSPIWYNPDFQVNNQPLHLAVWEQNGITHLHHLFSDNTFMSYTNLLQKYKIKNGNFLHYLQVKNIIKKRIPTLQSTLRPPALAEAIIKLSPTTTKTLSKIYKLLLSTDTIHLPISKWESDLSISPEPDFWTQICDNAFKMTKYTNLQLIQYKILHRTHITQYMMNKMGFSDSDICLQCSQNTADAYFHALWLCTPVKNFWTNVSEKLSAILNCRIPLSPSLCLLGDLTTTDLPRKQSQSLLVVLAIAKKTILVNWKNKQSLNINLWLNLLINHISMEKISASNKNQLLNFIQTWSLYVNYLNLNLVT
ncbi:uncharacterized protein LOC127534961 isoform X1 [Acanthochromis polyacanthus]|uniref:uncharacterized protein LOC127534961 isoform X1 n=1 Tax=Acanthochromis polyacanthus TaxID=80966 RepID=UPI0022343A49|nr:uncharacterized protein LOC127534961 isoform X1 [Acanthochromis polyacanthus]